MRVATHEPEPTDKYITVHSQGVDEVLKVFSFHHTNVLELGNRVVSELEFFVFDSAEPYVEFFIPLPGELLQNHNATAHPIIDAQSLCQRF